MDERVWTDRPLGVGAPGIEAPGCRITCVSTGIQSLVSGNLAAACASLAPGAPSLGFAEVPTSDTYAIRIARDHALLVTPQPPETKAGWHDAGFALSPAGARYSCLQLTGPAAEDILAHGLASAPPHGSASAAVLCAGTTALVTGHADGLHLWVDPAHLTFFSGFLIRAAGHPA